MFGMPLSKIIGVSVSLLVVFYFFAPDFSRHINFNDGGRDLPEEFEEGTVSIPNFDEKRFVYFGNEALNKSFDCGLVYPVERNGGHKDPASVLLSLFEGPTKPEIEEGYSSMFSASTAYALKKLTVRDGVAAVDLEDIRNVVPNVSSSCGSEQFISSVEETLFQFGGIKKVIFAIDGNPETFYEWTQLGCGEENYNCSQDMF